MGRGNGGEGVKVHARVSSSAPKCASCGGACQAADDAWVCTKCGDEWYPDHGPEYAMGDEEEASMSARSENPNVCEHGYRITTSLCPTWGCLASDTGPDHVRASKTPEGDAALQLQEYKTARQTRDRVILQLFQDHGWSVARIASECGLTYAGVRKVLIREGAWKV